MPTPEQQSWVKSMLGALKLFHGDIAISNIEPEVVGGPGAREPAVAPLPVGLSYLPKPTAVEPPPQAPLRPDPNPVYQPPMIGGPGASQPSLMSVAGTIGGLTTAPVSAYLGSLLDQPGAHRAAAGKAWEALKSVPSSLFQKHADQQFSTPSEEARKRGVELGGAGTFADMVLDPATYVGGDVMDLGKLGVLGAMALPTGAKKLKAAAAAVREGKALAKALEAAAPAMREPLAQLAEKYPQLAKAIGLHAPEVALQGTNRPLAARFDRVVDDIYNRTLVQPGTSTYPLTGQVEVPTSEFARNEGVMMGQFSNQSGKTKAIPFEQFNRGDVRKYLEQHADLFAKNKDRVLGTWISTDPETGAKTVYLDVSKKYETPRQATVNAWTQKQPGAVRDPATGTWPQPQKAGFNLDTFEEPPVGNFAEFVGSPAFQTRLDEMFELGTKVMNGKDWWNLYGSDLERVYGKERVAPLAAMLASTSPASAPVHNLRTASEYLRRLIKNEPIIQPKFRIPKTAVGSRTGTLGAMAPGDFNRPGTKMPMEKTRAPNLRKAVSGGFAAPPPVGGTREAEAAWRAQQLGQDKVNDMFHALTGMDVGVYDRRYAKVAEDWEKGIYAENTKDKLEGSMEAGKVSSYALVENALRDGAKRRGMSLATFTANVWEGIGETIKKTGQLYGMKQQAHSIPEASLGFPGIFQRMVEEKAKAWGVTVEEFEKRLRNGDAELLTTILATPVGLAAYKKWLRQSPATPPGA